MLARARADTTDERIRYELRDLETLELPAGSFDLAYSALALHDIVNLGRLVGVMRQALDRAGASSSRSSIRSSWRRAGPRGCVIETVGVWPLDRYAEEGLRVTDWLAPGVHKQHRTIGTTVNPLVDAGFTISRQVEWSPSPDQIAEDPALAEERDRPMFLLLAADRTQ